MSRELISRERAGGGRQLNSLNAATHPLFHSTLQDRFMLSEFFCTMQARRLLKL